jgi:multiple sugar transport system substrate-binding protein
MLWKLWRRLYEPAVCQMVDERLEAYLDGALPPAQAWAITAHLEQCAACQAMVRQESQRLERFRALGGAVRRLPPHAAAQMRRNVRQRLYWRFMMQQTTRTIQGAFALLALILITGGVFWWWQQSEIEPLATTPPATPAAVTEAEQVTLTLAVESSALPRYRPLIAAFEQENEDIRVRLVSLDEVADPGESGIRALATSFDVFAYSPNRQGDTQFLLDLRPLLALDPAFDANDFLPGLLPPDSEPLWAVPTGAAYYLTFFDKSAFDAAGLPYPELDWTAEEFLTAAQTLTLRENDNVTQWGYVPGQMRYPTLLAARLTGPLDSGDSLRLTDPDVAAAVQWVSDLFTVHQVAPWLDDYRPVDRRMGGDQTPTGLINSGMAAMWHTTHLLYDENDSDVGVTAVPRGPRGLSAEPIVYGLAVSRGANNPQAAWRLLHYLSRQPPQDMPPIFAAPVPARQSVATATNYWEQTPADLAAALHYTAENNAAPRLTYPAVEALQQAFAAHIDDDLPVAVALDQLPAQPTAPTEAEEIVVVAPSPPPDDDRETVRIVFATEHGLSEAHRRLANQFQQESPGINVQIVARDVFASHALDRVAGSDCFVGEPSFFWHDDDARAGILPLTPLLEVDGALRPDEFYPAAIEALMADGELWGIPAWIHPPYLEYNRELFAEAGIPAPPLDWTLDDFLDVAQQLSVGEGETKQYAYAEFTPLFALGFLQTFGVDVVDNSAAVPDFNYEAAAEMIAWHVDLVRLHQAQPLIGDMSASGFAD